MIPTSPAASVGTEPKRSMARADAPIDMIAIAIVSGMNARPVSIAS